MAYLHNTVSSQLPNHVVKDYPLFVEFLKAYYQWMETKGQPYFALTNHLDWLNFKDSMDDYVEFLRKEYIFNLPAEIDGGLELFLKNSKDFHLAAGTEDSFKFIFKILYGESAGDVELYFPRREILKVSDGSWNNGETVMYVTDSGQSDKFLYRVIKQTREIYPGVFRYAYAIVQRISNRYAGKFKVTELYLTEVQGEFEIGYPVEVENNFEWIFPTGNLVTVEEPGSLYYLDDKLTVEIPPTFTQSLIADQVGEIDTRISSIYNSSELIVTIDGNEVQDFSYNGRTIGHPSIIADSVITVTFPTFAGFLYINEVGDNGNVEQITVVDSPIGITEDANINVENGIGVGFAGKISRSLIRSIPGYYMNDDGHLSSTKVIQDSNYYQEFSYVIKSSLGIDTYRDVVLKLLHPAGMKMFGQVNIIELIKLMIRDTYELVIAPKDVEVDISEAHMYTDYAYIDKRKNDLFDTTWNTFNFKDFIVEEFTNNGGRDKLNVQDVELRVNTPYKETLEFVKQFEYEINFPFAQDII